MKVIKCLEHIPKELRGKVVEDRFCNLYVEESGVEIRKTLDEYHYYNLKPTDTFPLPKQGDKVEVSDDGSFRDLSIMINMEFLCYNNIRKQFCIEETDGQGEPYTTYWKYIKPIEAKVVPFDIIEGAKIPLAEILMDCDNKIHTNFMDEYVNYHMNKSQENRVKYCKAIHKLQNINKFKGIN